MDLCHWLTSSEDAVASVLISVKREARTAYPKAKTSARSLRPAAKRNYWTLPLLSPTLTAVEKHRPAAPPTPLECHQNPGCTSYKATDRAPKSKPPFRFLSSFRQVSCLHLAFLVSLWFFLSKPNNTCRYNLSNGRQNRGRQRRLP